MSPEARRKQKSIWLAQIKAKTLYCVLGGELILNTNELSRDHLIPTSRGGEDVASNVAPACKKHNQEKGSLTLDEYIIWKDLENKRHSR